MSLRILVAYSMSSSHVQTTWDYLLALKRYSDFDVSYVHVTHNAVMNFDIDDFDVVFQNYCARLCFDGYVSQSYRGAMKRFRGLKILAVQDEYDHTNVLKAAIKDLGFHVVLTCVPQTSLEYVYPRHEFPGVEFMHVLTGYVPDDLAANPRPIIPLTQRPIVVGYRGRDLGGFYGRLAFEKYEIGRRMREICLARGIHHDIALDEDSRIYGPAWFDFIGSCRSILGSEFGSNVFDFDGSIKRMYKKMAALRGGKVSYDEFIPLVAQRESEISMGQISPRVFECAVLKTPMVLFRGTYSGIIEPDAHYIALEKDFSNVDEVLARLENIQALQAMAERAYNHLIASGQFGYRVYSRQLRFLIERKVNELLLPLRSASRNSNQIDPDNILCQTPTALPMGLARFDFTWHRWRVSVLEKETVRLTGVFDAMAAIYLAAFERLEGVFNAEAKRLLLDKSMANEILSADRTSAMDAYDRLEHLLNWCRERRECVSSKWRDLRAQMLGFAKTEAMEQQLHDLDQRPTAFLEDAIKMLNSEIDQLNVFAREAVVLAERAALNEYIWICRSPSVTYRTKAQILARLVVIGAHWRVGSLVRPFAAAVRVPVGHLILLLAARMPLWLKQLILRIPFFRRFIEFIRSRRKLRTLIPPSRINEMNYLFECSNGRAVRPTQLPKRAARQLPNQSTTLCVESSSTGDTFRRGEPHKRG